MILQNVLKENKLVFSDKGEECLMLAIKQVLPNLKINKRTLGIFVGVYEFSEEDCIKIIHLTSKYAKLYALS